MPEWTILVITLVWVGSEVLLAATRRSRDNVMAGADRSSLRVVWITIGAAVVVGQALSGLAPLPGNRRAWELAGLALIALGLLVRWAAILTLQRAFTVDVAIAPGQRIVERGLYRDMRHPSYLGSLLSVLGLGVFDADWLALPAILLPVAAAFGYRIRVEEKALHAAFGDAYADYARRTRRLIPFVY